VFGTFEKRRGVDAAEVRDEAVGCVLGVARVAAHATRSDWEGMGRGQRRSCGGAGTEEPGCALEASDRAGIAIRGSRVRSNKSQSQEIVDEMKLAGCICQGWTRWLLGFCQDEQENRGERGGGGRTNKATRLGDAGSGPRETRESAAGVSGTPRSGLKKLDSSCPIQDDRSARWVTCNGDVFFSSTRKVATRHP
jgi:hypothetical protein